jgi:hypothetical protein
LPLGESLTNENCGKLVWKSVGILTDRPPPVLSIELENPQAQEQQQVLFLSAFHFMLK